MKAPGPIERNICPYCTYGLPPRVEEVRKKYGCLGAEHGFGLGMGYGPGHITFADENFRDDHLDFCLEEVAKADRLSNAELPENYPGLRCSDCFDSPREHLVRAKAALLALKEIPIHERIWEEPDAADAGGEAEREGAVPSGGD